MPKIETILKQIFIELGITEARHSELIDKFEVLVSKLFLTLLFDQHLKTEEAELMLVNFELSKKHNTDFTEYLAELIPLTVLDYYLYIACITVLKQYIETLIEKEFLTMEKVNKLLA